MKKSFRIFSFAVALMMLGSSLNFTALAAERTASQKRDLVLEIRDGKVAVAETGLIDIVARVLSEPTETMTFSIEEKATETTSSVVVDITSMKQFSTQEHKLQATELLLEELDYSEEQIAAMSDKNKLALTNGTELGISRSSVTAKPNDNAYDSTHGWVCSLSYTRQDVDTYRFSNFSYELFPQGRWVQAISVSAFSIASATVELEYQYNEVEYNGDYVNTHSGTATLGNWSQHSGFRSAQKAPKDGTEYVYFEYDIPHSYIDDFSYYTLSFEATATSVTLPPAEGATGGQFSIYGYTDHITGFTSPFSISIGAGVSLSAPISGERVTHCIAYLEAVLYR